MIACKHCRYFRPDAINPPAGMGRCMHDARHGYFYPGEKHRCDDFSDTPVIRKQENTRGQSPQRPAR